MRQKFAITGCDDGKEHSLILVPRDLMYGKGICRKIELPYGGVLVGVGRVLCGCAFGGGCGVKAAGADCVRKSICHLPQKVILF